MQRLDGFESYYYIFAPPYCDYLLMMWVKGSTKGMYGHVVFLAFSSAEGCEGFGLWGLHGITPSTMWAIDTINWENEMKRKKPRRSIYEFVVLMYTITEYGFRLEKVGVLACEYMHNKRDSYPRCILQWPIWGRITSESWYKLRRWCVGTFVIQRILNATRTHHGANFLAARWEARMC